MARVRALAPHHLVHDNRNNTNSISTSCIPNSFFIISIATKYSCSRRRRRICCKYEISKTPSLELEQAGEGGKMVVELVGAFNHITHRMSTTTSDTPSTSSSIILFNALKLSLPLLHSLSNEHNSNRSLRRSPLASAFSVALFLADLRMDAEVISAALLFPAVAASAISLPDVRRRLHSPATAHLLHDSLRLSTSPLLHKHEHFEFDGDGDGDDSSSAALRKFYLKHFDSRALVLHLALKLDSMRHLHYLPRYHQQLLSLQVLRIYAPLAHALSLPLLSLELEDLAFRSLFPYSYLYLDAWLRSHDTLDDDDDDDGGGGGDGDGDGDDDDDEKRPLIQVFKEELLHSLKSDPLLSALVDDISVQGRYKSRYSTMRKILKDGRRPDQVYDVLGLRVVLRPRDQQYNDNDKNDDDDAGERGCYRVGEIVRSLWKEVPHRTKDYIANPKPNGYRSLHMAVDVSDNGRRRPLMEIQIRTEKMDLLAVGGTASHSLYKAGLTDPQEAKRLKAIMVAAAELAALRLQDLPSTTSHKGIEIDRRDRVFRLLDKNGDGRISIEELMEVMEELGAPGEDAREMMQLLDSNSDGSLSSEEFDLFQKQVDFMRNLEDRDDQYKMMLNEKLQIAENSDSIQVYTEGPGGSLGNN